MRREQVPLVFPWLSAAEQDEIWRQINDIGLAEVVAQRHLSSSVRAMIAALAVHHGILASGLDAMGLAQTSRTTIRVCLRIVKSGNQELINRVGRGELLATHAEKELVR